MKLGAVLKKERERRAMTAEEIAALLGLPVEQYRELEAGEPAAEEWGPKFARLAVDLFVPMSWLIGAPGAAGGRGRCGELIKVQRERQGLSREQLASRAGLPAEELAAIEDGRSPLETYAPLLWRFAEAVEQPMVNLFYPCGLPLDRLRDYP